MKTFRELVVWQKSMDLSILVYEFTKQLPKSEQYGLVSQIRRAAVSIPSNIAEGSKRHNRKEFAQFCGIAKGSAAEIETQLVIINKVYDLNIDKLLDILIEIQKMLESLANKLKTK